MELIAQFDPFLMGYLKKFGSLGSGKQSYLSPTIYEEILLLMAKYVKNYIVAELKSAKYFSVSVDSTPDQAHVDQLTVIVHYVIPGKSIERFLTFLQAGSHKAEVLVASLLEFLKKEGIHFEDCRGQSYDNASKMSSHYTGMQARFK
ncbi:zinc finger MYM-type protein 1 [Octopus bimaculoides]|nr:zinc finger MYM-type protein 1 [Octopus bimaculoides]|eukprot:XP_014779092.1 PREDICTED: zinc finger MYM-type protein 1-like [Octopus bimaculoides]